MSAIVSRNIKQDHPDYPSVLNARLGASAPKQMVVLGDISILKRKPIAIFCSDKSSLDQMIMVDGLVRKWCQEDQTLISGFQTKNEKINSNIILSYQRPAILCLGSAFSKRNVSKKIKKALEEDRLLLLCPFENQARITKDSDLQRNLIVAALSDSILVAPRKGDFVTETLLSKTKKWNIPTTVLEITKEIRTVDVDLKNKPYSVVLRVLPLFSNVEKMGQIIGDNGLGKVRRPRD